MQPDEETRRGGLVYHIGTRKKRVSPPKNNVQISRRFRVKETRHPKTHKRDKKCYALSSSSSQNARSHPRKNVHPAERTIIQANCLSDFLGNTGRRALNKRQATTHLSIIYMYGKVSTRDNFLKKHTIQFSLFARPAWPARRKSELGKSSDRWGCSLLGVRSGMYFWGLVDPPSEV